MIDVLRKLDEIGGEVAEAELAYHLGPEAAEVARRAAADGLVETRTYFSLTDKGKAAIEHRDEVPA